MFNLITFYFKTFFKSIKNLIPILLLSFTIIGFCIFFNVNRPVSDLDYSMPPIDTFGTPDEELQTKLNNFEDEINMSYSEQDWTTFYDKTIKYYKTALDNDLVSDKNKLIKEIDRYIFLQKGNISFVDEAAHNDALLFLKYLLIEPIVLLILVIVLISSSQIFSSEIENKTYKLLYTQPMSKNKILMSKLLSTILINFFIIFSLILLCFLYQCITKNLGSPNFLVKCVVSKEMIYVPLIKYVLYEFALLSILIILTCCIGTFISILINNSAASICVSTVLYGLLYILFKNNPNSLIQKYNPCAYVDIDRILSASPVSSLYLIIPRDPSMGRPTESLQHLTNLNLSSGVIFIIICIVFILFLNTLLINKKRINN